MINTVHNLWLFLQAMLINILKNAQYFDDELHCYENDILNFLMGGCLLCRRPLAKKRQRKKA